MTPAKKFLKSLMCAFAKSSISSAGTPRARISAVAIRSFPESADIMRFNRY
jgi:hypothetical protein